MFDLEQAKIASGLSSEILARLEKKIREDFPDDAMMFELHFIRTLQALKEGTITLEQVLAQPITV